MIKKIVVLLAVTLTRCWADPDLGSVKIEGTLIIDNNKAVFGDHPRAGMSEPLPCIIYLADAERFRAYCDMSRYVSPDQPISQGIVRVKNEVFSYLNWNGRTIPGVKDRLHEQATGFLSNSGLPKGALQPVETLFLGFNAAEWSIWNPRGTTDVTLFSYSLRAIKNPDIRVEKAADAEKGSTEYTFWVGHTGAALGRFCFGRLTIFSDSKTHDLMKFTYEDRIFNSEDERYNSQPRTTYLFNTNKRTPEAFPLSVLLDRELAKQVIITDLRAKNSKGNVGYYLGPRDGIPFGLNAPPLQRAIILEEQQHNKALRATWVLLFSLAFVGFLVYKYQRALRIKQNNQINEK